MGKRVAKIKLGKYMPNTCWYCHFCKRQDGVEVDCTFEKKIMPIPKKCGFRFLKDKGWEALGHEAMDKGNITLADIYFHRATNIEE